jgi:hypothetical protein
MAEGVVQVDLDKLPFCMVVVRVGIRDERRRSALLRIVIISCCVSKGSWMVSSFAIGSTTTCCVGVGWFKRQRGPVRAWRKFILGFGVSTSVLDRSVT